MILFLIPHGPITVHPKLYRIAIGWSWPSDLHSSRRNRPGFSFRPINSITSPSSSTGMSRSRRWGQRASSSFLRCNLLNWHVIDCPHIQQFNSNSLIHRLHNHKATPSSLSPSSVSSFANLSWHNVTSEPLSSRAYVSTILLLSFPWTSMPRHTRFSSAPVAATAASLSFPAPVTLRGKALPGPARDFY